MSEGAHVASVVLGGPWVSICDSLLTSLSRRCGRHRGLTFVDHIRMAVRCFGPPHDRAGLVAVRLESGRAARRRDLALSSDGEISVFIGDDLDLTSGRELNAGVATAMERSCGPITVALTCPR